MQRLAIWETVSAQQYVVLVKGNTESETGLPGFLKGDGTLSWPRTMFPMLARATNTIAAATPGDSG